MSFYTSLTGLNGAQADIAAISNNVANVGTTGFKLSRAQFGDIFATSPLQNASGAIGSGTILKKVQQQFTQGNISASQNSLDMAISGQGFFALKPSLTSTQTVYTRNGSFSVNNNRYVVDSQGQYLQVFPVNSDGSVIATGTQSAKNLQLPSTSGLPNATNAIQLGLNLPADATIIPSNPIYTSSNPYKFDRTNASTYNQSTSITIYDSLGNPTIATIYYVKTLNATSAIPNNRWQTHVFVGDKEVNPSLITSKDDQSRTIYINKYGQTTTDPTSFDSSFVANQPSPLYYQDDQIKKSLSTPAKVVGSIQNLVGFDFGDTDANKVTIVTDPAKYDTTRESGKVSSLTSPFWGTDMFTISVDGSAPQSISINAGSYTGSQLAAEMTRAVNAKYSNANYFRINDTYRDTGNNVVSGNDVFNINLARTESDGSTTQLKPPLQIDMLGTAGADGTPAVVDSTGVGSVQQLNYLDLKRDDLIALAQKKVNQALNARHAEFGKNSDWPDTTNPPIIVGFNVATRALTFKADSLQLGTDAALPQNRYQTLQVFNPNSVTNDLGIPSITASQAGTIGTNTYWSGSAVLPSGPPLTAVGDQRTGITVSYNKDSRQFVFSSGTTGESSSIKVGRATLAQSQDIKPQINSYDFSSLALPANAPVTLESDGKSFTYFTDATVKSNATAPDITPDTLIAKLQQAVPVTFNSAKQIQAGTATSQAEQQVLPVYGNLMAGDTFNLNVYLKPGDTTATNVAVGPLVFDTTTLGATFAPPASASDRVNAMISMVNSSLKTAIGGTYSATTSLVCKLVPGQTNQLLFDYQSAGIIPSVLSMSQSVRGTDGNAALTALNFTNQTVYTSPTIVTQSGNAKTKEVQSFVLKPTNGTDYVVHEGDVFVVNVPKSDGTALTKRITIHKAGANAGDTLTTQDLIDSLNSDPGVVGPPAIPAISTFGSFNLNSKDTNKNTIEFTFNQPAVIAGKVSIVQDKVAAFNTATPPVFVDITKVRPDSIGPYSISLDGNHRLTVQGNPNGEAFHLNVQTGGVVSPVEAQGATGSKSQSGVQIGQSLATTSNSATIYAGNNDLLGIGAVKAQQAVAGTGLASTAATAYGSSAITPMSQTFLLNESLGENKLTFTVDGITGTIILPIRAYTGDTFASAIQQRVNQIQDPVTGRVVSGVSVKFDANNNRLVFTSGTTGSTSQINVVGSANFGLNSVTQTSGSVPSITNLVQATDANGNKLYVDGSGNISTVAPSTKLQSWSPLYLTPGELTFDTAGKLLSPKQGVVYSPFDPGNGSNPLNLTIDYGKFSTQYTQPFSVQSLTQDGYPSGSLNGLTIDSSGTVIANYTNGQTNALGKVMIANFANPNGLKQIGNADYVATSVSGTATLGQAGSDGLGSIQAGALEQSNVDITEELVKLITAQRNFQANSKAIETETSLTQTIIQIRA